MQHCQPISQGNKPMTPGEIENYLNKVGQQWCVNIENSNLTREFTFKNYLETMAFTNAVAWIAHQQDHHPELTVTYNRCKISYSTHSVQGLTKNDFICAAHINQLIQS